MAHSRAEDASDHGFGGAGAALPEDEEVPEYTVQVTGFEVARRGRHVVFSLTIGRDNASWTLRRRFRQVLKLHERLLHCLGRSAMKEGLPTPPPRVTCRSLFFGQHDAGFLSARSEQLQQYFEALLRYIPFVDQCEVLREFLCSVDVANMSYDALLDLGQALGRVTAQAPPPESVAALPKRNLEESPSLSPSGSAVCVICQEYFEQDQDVRVLPCGHEYHFACIEQWISVNNTCCVCQCVAVPLAEPGSADHGK